MRLAIVVVLVGCGRVDFDELRDAQGSPEIVELSFRGSAPCVRSADGRVACWGENENGQLGRGNASAFEGPGLVPLDNVVSLATGENTAFAIDRDGALWAWGDNRDGQLGLGTRTTLEATPRRVSLPPVLAVATGQFHTCAITETRELYCWGESACGQLGIGSIETTPTPTKAIGVSDARQVAVSDRETCLLDGSGAVLCMGSPYFDAGICVNARDVATVRAGLTSIREVSGGCHNQMCAVDEAGQASCWGENKFGVGGDGTETPRANPTPVMSLVNARSIGAGFDASCALTGDNNVYCWGRNPGGQLGIGDSGVAETKIPARLPFFTGALAIDQLEVGCNASCVRSGTDLYCWGVNAEHIVDDTGVPAYAPLQRMGLPF